MANYRKSFNFRSGVQVDNDKFLVDQRGNVGVGTSAPNRVLDVYGTARINGNTETETLNVTGLGTFNSLVSIGETAYLDPISGIISAVSYRGDGSLLANVIAIATNGWVVANQGLSTSLNVFVGPFPEDNVLPTPLGRFQVGTGSSIFIIQDTGGWVGLGTTVPSTKLDVRGNTSLVGNLTVSDLTTTNTLFVDDTTTFRGSITGGDGSYERLSWSPSTGALAIGNASQGALADFTIYGENYGAAITLKATGDARITGDLNVTGVSTFSKRIKPKIIQMGELTDLTDLNYGFEGINGDGVDNTITLGGDLILTHLNDTAYSRYNWIGCDEYPLVFGVKGENAEGSSGTNFYYSGVLRIEPGNDDSPENTSYVQLRHGTSYTTNEGTLTTIGTGVSITGEVFADRLDITGQTELSNVNSTGIVTATRFVGNVTGIASEAIILSDGANITTGTISDDRLPDLITSNIYRIAGISTINKLRVNNIGIGTDVLTRDFVIKKATSVVAELISTEGSAKISLGSEEVTNDNTSAIEYTPTSESLEINNYGSGGVNFHTHKGTGDLVGVSTGGFFFKSGSTETILVNFSADGRSAFNQEVSEDTETDYAVVVNGKTLTKGSSDIQGDLDINGALTGVSTATMEDLVVTGTIQFEPDQNFRVTTGISTFNELVVLNDLNLDNASTSVGLVTFNGNVTFGSTLAGNSINSFNKVNFYDTQFCLKGTKLLYDIAQNYYEGYEPEELTDPRNQDLVTQYDLDPNIYLPGFGYGDIQVQTGGMSIITKDKISIHPSIAQSTTGNWPDLTPAENLGMGLEYVVQDNLCMIGINTLFTRTVFDLGHAIPEVNSYFVPPRIGTVGINTIRQLWDPNIASNWNGHNRAYQSTPYGLVSGGIIFDVDKNQLQIAVGSTTFCGIATFTNNHSGHESFVPPKVTDAERTTLTNAGIPEGSVVYNTDTDTLQQYDGSAWSSLVKQTGIGTQATISVVGSQIVFTVAGIGSTSLTLV